MNAFAYLDGQQTLYLKEIHYTVGSDGDIKGDIKLGDELHVEASLEKGLTIEVTRKIFTVADDAYLLSVTMGSTLSFKQDHTVSEDTIRQIDWKKELKSKDRLLSVLTARISLLISQITSSFGGTPIVTQPALIKEV